MTDSLTTLHYPWSTLGIEPTPDEKAIKRAYAKLLKVTRADDDPVAFGQLRQAYELAMQIAPHFDGQPQSNSSLGFREPGASPNEVLPDFGAPHPTGSTSAEHRQETAQLGSAIGQADENSIQPQSVVQSWLLALTPFLTNDDPDGAAQLLKEHLESPHASLPLIWQQYSHELLHYCARHANTPPAFIAHAADLFSWNEHWLPMECHADLGVLQKRKAWQQGSHFAQSIGDDDEADINAQLAMWLEGGLLPGLEDRPWFELGMMQALPDTQVPLHLMDAIAAKTGWDRDLAYLRMLNNSVVERFLSHVYWQRQVIESANYEQRFRQFVRLKPAPESQASHRAAKALLSPYTQVLQHCQALRLSTQNHASQMIADLDNHYPAFAQKLNAQVLAFWRMPHANYGPSPELTLRALGATFFFLLFSLGRVIWPPVENIGSDNSHFLPGVLLWAVLTFGSPLLLWWLDHRWGDGLLERLRQKDTELGRKYAPAWLKPVMTTEARVCHRLALCLALGVCAATWHIPPFGKAFHPEMAAFFLVAPFANFVMTLLAGRYNLWRAERSTGIRPIAIRTWMIWLALFVLFKLFAAAGTSI